MSPRTHGGTFLFVAVLTSCVTIGLAQIAKCNNRDLDLPIRGLDDAVKECGAKTPQACKLHCVWKKIGNLGTFDNKLIVAKYMFLIRAFPPDVRVRFVPQAMKCMAAGKELPRDFGPTCNEFEAFAKCVSMAIPKTCTVENSVMFWKD